MIKSLAVNSVLERLLVTVGFPLEPESKIDDAADRRTDSLTARRDSIRRRHSSVTRQARYDAEAGEAFPQNCS